VTVNTFNPGMLPGTGLARDYSAPMRFGWNYVLPVRAPRPTIRRTADRCLCPSSQVAAWLGFSFVRTVEASGAALARLVTDPSLETTTGTYFDGLRPIRSSPESYDEAKAADLWQVSLELSGLVPSTSPSSSKPAAK
jgi:hypothetical protein